MPTWRVGKLDLVSHAGVDDDLVVGLAGGLQPPADLARVVGRVVVVVVAARLYQQVGPNPLQGNQLVR